MVADVTEAEFKAKVVERSHEVPVVVDFWAEWCGPCRALGPAIEAEVRKREGAVELAKVDVDSNQSLAQAFGIRGIPDVKAFSGGNVVAQFTGAIPPAKISEFLDSLLPSEADTLSEAGDEDSLRDALRADPNHRDAALGLARILIARGDREEARELLTRHGDADFTARGLIARLDTEERAAAGDEAVQKADAAVAAWAEGDIPQALELFQRIIAEEQDPELRDLVRRMMVAIFTELGDDPLAAEHRKRLAAALN